MEDLHGRTCVITGGAGGLGRAMVERFVADGMQAVVCDIDGAAVDAVVDAVRRDGGDAVGVVADVSAREGAEAVLEAALAVYGGAHVVCANAGVVLGGRVDHLTDDEWRWVLDVDLWGPIHLVRTFLPVLESQGEGHLVATASTSGLGAPLFNGPYSVSKAGVIALMETVRRELDERRSPVGASVLCPGPVATGLVGRSSAHAASLGDRSHTADGHRFATASTRALADSSVTPDAVAAMVADAVRTNRFWILTHPEWADVVRRRTEAMVTTGHLTGRPNA